MPSLLLDSSATVRRLLFVIALLSLSSPAAQAQQERGDVELQLAGSISTVVGDDDASSTTGLFQMKAGYYLSDRIEVGAFPSLLVVSTRTQPYAAAETEATVGLGVFAVYSFLASDATTVPYVGGQLYRSDVSDPDQPSWLGVNGGVKIFLNRNAAFDVGGNYLLRLDGGGSQLLLFQVGLSFLL